MRNRISLSLTAAGAILCALAHPVTAQPGTFIGQVLAGGPISAGTGDHALVCATNLGSTNVSVTLEILNALTGAVLLQHSATLGAAGSATSAGACLDSGTGSTAIIGVLIGRVIAVNPQPLPPAPQPGIVIGSLQVLGMGTSGAVMNPRFVALTPLHPPDPCITIP